MNKEGRIALITGGSRGIGQAIALQLASEGCHIAFCARGNESVEETLSKIQSYGVKAYGAVADVTKQDQLEKFIQQSTEKLGKIDFLVCNAGGVFGKGLLESTSSDWEQTFQLNLFHCVNAIRLCVPLMNQQGGGSILLIASISGTKPQPKAQYGCAKAAQIYLAKSLAYELAAHNIRINALSPGSTIFPNGGWEKFQANNPELFAQFAEQEFPQGRLATLSEIANVATFILSDRANWINGTNIPVDGAQLSPSALGY
ncbi:3-oxoacyl-(acyl-carrier-protein) reductase [Crinalium epipsammum PCC 9333]|uniref:3-oxoacyl-(Acyl-carrier-protein) reductase n=1 Tax=Crinalium epipsammum PCC 9333 TaxID=1173022 RepID=K9VVB4_9CYAN|nr:SDR family oxidoreductase [Crinalium epipsammum]AFZ11504.1 3-oxoacyl-(acyl-carrier-protein) reductase [Crinalium epipsammum PCC 9333]